MYDFTKSAVPSRERVEPKPRLHWRRARYLPFAESLDPRISLSQIGPGGTSHLMSPPTNQSPGIVRLLGPSFVVSYTGSENAAKPAVKDQVNVEFGAGPTALTSGSLATTSIKDQINIELNPVKVTLPDPSIHVQGIQHSTIELDSPGDKQ